MLTDGVRLRHVYARNVLVEGGGAAWCRNCARIVIDRYGNAVLGVDGKCRSCRTPIAGVQAV